MGIVIYTERAETIWIISAEKLLNRKENYMSKKNFADMSIEERQKILFEMSDKDIDFTDIPEINEDFLKTVKKIEHPQKSKTDTIKIKPHLLNWFKNHAQENSYEALINNVLENYIQHHIKN